MSDWNPDKVRLNIARDLREVRQLFRGLRTEAINRAGDPKMPGGDAMVLLVPGANVEAFGYAQLSAIFGRTPEDSIECDDMEPPLSFLAGWSDIVRDRRDQPTGLGATIDREADYLLGSLDFMLSIDEYGDMVFIEVEDFAEGLSRVRRRLEDVLRDGHRAIRIKAECKSCADAPRLCLRHGEDESKDHWYCPSCYHLYDEVGVAQCWRQMFVRRGDAPEWVPLRQAAAALNRPVSTVRTWTLSPDRGDGEPMRDADGDPVAPRVLSERRDDGLTWVLWHEVRAADDTTRRRGANRVVA